MGKNGKRNVSYHYKTINAVHKLWSDKGVYLAESFTAFNECIKYRQFRKNTVDVMSLLKEIKTM